MYISIYVYINTLHPDTWPERPLPDDVFINPTMSNKVCRTLLRILETQQIKHVTLPRKLFSNT